MLVATVKSIAEQNYDLDRCEVIIVTQADRESCSGLIDSLDKLNTGFTFQMLFRDRDETISMSRNYGASIANGDYLAFIDSDIRLSENWVSVMIDELKNPEYILVAAVQFPDEKSTLIDTIRSSMSEANLGDSNQALTGQNLFLRRTDFNRSDQFPEYLETCEDSVFTQSLLGMGKLKMTDRANFVHLGEDVTFASMFKKEIWRSKSNIQTLRGRKTILKELPSVVIPFSVILGMLMSIPALLLGYVTLAFFSILFSLTFPLLYAIRLKLKTSRALSIIHLTLFYFIYLVARGTGMLNALFNQYK